MAVEFEFAKDPGTGVMVEATARLCLTEDDRLVPEGDPAGRWLYCIPGRMIPRAEAEKYGLLQSADDPAPESADEPGDQEGDGEESSAEPAEPPAPPIAEAPKTDIKAVRAWALEQGLDVPKRGRISETVVELYNEAHAEASGEEGGD